MNRDNLEGLIDFLSTNVSTADLEAFFFAQGFGDDFGRPTRGWGRKKRVTEALKSADRVGRLAAVTTAAAERFRYKGGNPDPQQIHLRDAEVEDYLGFSIESRAEESTGSTALHWFQVSGKDQRVEFSARFVASYTSAAEAGDTPENLAEVQGRRYVHGMIHLANYKIGGEYEMAINDLARDAMEQSDEDLRQALLEAARRMLSWEASSSEIPALDVSGVAAVLGEPTERLKSVLIELELLGLIEPNAQTLGHTLTEGALRIKREGLNFLDETGSSVSERPVAHEEHTTSDAVRVAVSYSHDSDRHKARVLALSSRLRKMGIDVDLDQYHSAPVEGWPNWMETQIAQARFVLVICTPVYLERVTGGGDPQVGLGSRYEGQLINQEIFEAGGRNDKFLPIIPESEHVSAIPPWLAPFTRYDLSADDDFSNLYRQLTGQPAVIAPSLGEVVEMPPTDEGPLDQEVVEKAEPLPTWHVDLVLNWQQEGGPSRYAVRWTPGLGFSAVDSSDRVLESTGAQPMPEGLPINSVGVSYLVGDRLRFDFEDPITPVTARLHIDGEAHEPHESGGGDVHYYVYRLDLIPGLEP